MRCLQKKKIESSIVENCNLVILEVYKFTKQPTNLATD